MFVFVLILRFRLKEFFLYNKVGDYYDKGVGGDKYGFVWLFLFVWWKKILESVRIILLNFFRI